MTSGKLKQLHLTLLLAALCLLTVLVYLPGLSGDYMFDDMPNLLQNSRLQVDALDMDSLMSAAYSSGSGLFRRPVSMATFAINQYFFDIDPWSYKVANLAIHILTGVVIFLLCRLLVSSYRTRHNSHISDRAAYWLPVVVSGLWLVHPLNLTPVLYIVQRMTSLTALFTVCGLCLYTLGRQRMLAGKHGFGYIITGLVVFGCLATLSKESGLLLPLYMLVIEISLFRFRDHNGLPSKTVMGFFAIVILAPLCLFLLVLLTNPDSLLNYHTRDFTLLERVLTQARVLVFYLKLIIMPSITELGLHHDDISLSHGLLDPPTTLYSILGLAALLVAAIALLKTRPLASLGILWFFAGHALESTIFQLDIAYEHRNYLADMGIILALSSLAAQQNVTRLAHFTRAVLPVFFLLLFSYTTWLRADQWSDNVNHAIYEARHHPESPRAVFGAARIYARLALLHQPGMEEKAYHYLDRASALNETDILTDVIRIKLSSILGNPVQQAWIDNILAKVSRGPMRPTHIDSLYRLMSCIGDPCDIPLETMDKIFNVTLSVDGLEHLPDLHAKLLNVYGYFRINKCLDYEHGLALFRWAVDINPREPQHWINLIQLQIAMGRYDEAEQTLDKFRASDTYGSVVKEILELQSDIDNLRVAATTKTGQTLQQ
jgi:tetratricopeptide (TPR) repeat protein